MKKLLLFIVLSLGLMGGQAWAANAGNSTVFLPGVPNGPCSTWPTCPTVPNDGTHPFFFAPSTGSVFTVVGTISLPTNAALEGGGNLAAILARTPALNGDGGSPAHIVNTVTTADNNGAAFSSAVALTAGGAADSAGRSVEMLVTVSGNVSLQMSGSPHVISVAASPYTQTFPYAITAINSSGTTATATYANLH